MSTNRVIRPARNLLAGLANSIWSAALGIACVPLYLKYLGAESYGLIAFFTSAQALLQLLDLGLVPTMNREVASCSATHQFDEARTLLHSLSLIYWISALTLGIAIATLAPFIADHWLKATSLSHAQLTKALVVMAIVFACRWPIGIYQGAIIGAQRLVVTSALSMTMTTLSSAGAVLLLAFVAPSIEVYFMWQAAVGIAYAFAMRAAAWKVLGKPNRLKFDSQALRRVWRFSAGVSGIAVTGTILMQLDKVILSRSLTLSAFGAYALATTLSSGLYILLSPTFNVIYPRLTAIVASGNVGQLIHYYRVGTRLLLALLFPLASLMSFYSHEVLMLWTHDPAIAASAAPIVSIFIFGTALNGAMHFPYALQLAYGRTKLPLLINLILLALTLPTTVVLAYKFGAVGGASSWAIINALYVLIGTWLTHRTLLPSIGCVWLTADVLVPLIISVLLVGGVSLIVHVHSMNPTLMMLVGAPSAMVATLLIFITCGSSRTLLTQLARRSFTPTGTG